MKYFLVLAILFIAAGFLCLVNLPKSQSANKSMIIKIKSQDISVAVVDNNKTRLQGLSGVIELPENSGMLFVYDQSVYPAIWMKDMKFSIDIIWINERKKIIDISKNIFPNTYPQKFNPKDPAKYVLEVNANWCDKNNIKLGDEVKF